MKTEAEKKNLIAKARKARVALEKSNGSPIPDSMFEGYLEHILFADEGLSMSLHSYVYSIYMQMR